MLTKLLFTAAVIAGVALLYRKRRPLVVAAGAGDDGDASRSLSVRALAFGVVALLAAASVFIYLTAG